MKNTNICAALIGAALMIPAVGTAAGLDPAKAITQYRHDVWRVEEGLPQNTVPTIAQTTDGYIWFGTELGLVRFDGLRFTVFDKANTPQLKTNTIYALEASKDGSLWIGTNGGGLTHLDKGVFHSYTTADGLPNDAVLSVHQDRTGVLWVGTNGGGVARVEHGRFTAMNAKDGLPNNAVFAIAETPNGDLWFGTHDGLVRQSHGVMSVYRVKDGLRSAYIRAIHVDRSGAVWVGTSGGGLSHFKDGAFRNFGKKDGLPSESISSIREDEAGTLWIGTVGAGVCRYSAGKFTAYATGDGLSNDDVWALLYDRGGNLWIGTGGGGLNRLMNAPLTAFNTKEGLSSDAALPIFEDREGTLWIGTNGGGVNRMRDGRINALTQKDGLADNLVLTIAQDSTGAMWFGTRKGLNRYQDGKFKLYTRKNGLAGDIATASLADSRGRLWIGGRAGVSVFENGKFSVVQGLSNGPVQAIAEDHNHDIWVGTGGGGLNRVRNGQVEVFNTGRGLSNNVVMSLHEDAAGTLWIGTNGGGLNRLKDGRFASFTSKEGLPDDTIFRILEENGELWMTSNRGIFRAKLSDLERVADSHTSRQVHVVLYDKSDGMKSRECNGGFQPAGWRARDGKLWFPTMQGIVAVDPKKLSDTEGVPPVTIEKAAIDKQAVDPAQYFEAQPGAGDMEFHYAAISFRAPERTTFRYKLEGFDTAWTDAGTRREAYYTNIPPGRYRFLVTAQTADGAVNTKGSSMGFTLKPNWYASGLFRGFSLFVSLCSMLAVFWWRDRIAAKHRQRLEGMVAQRTTELSEQVRKEERARNELAQAQQRLIELSRQSGMAEVATGILHNVGNVLNSVNVSATMACDAAAEMRSENLVSAVAMLQEHSGDLTSFVRDDPKGRRVLPYLSRLGEHFQKQRNSLMSEVQLLREMVGHIKEIISTQQSYAKISGLTERIELSELVEDAIRIIQPGFERHDIRLERDFHPVPLAYTDRHKILQVLLNLLKNAKQAISDSQSKQRAIRIGIRQHGADRIRVEVKDTGVGVDPADLNRIFAQGFTTKAGGNGFGLHSSALAAQEMGGSLWADSDGPGEGATFTLELPIGLAEARQSSGPAREAVRGISAPALNVNCVEGAPSMGTV